MVNNSVREKLDLCIHLVEGCLESLLLCPLIPLAGPVCEKELDCTRGFTQDTSLKPLLNLNSWIGSPLILRS